jgi:DNA repair exonuclease SbcCD ATPase subunit
MGFNDEMDRYMRGRKHPSYDSKNSWWSKMLQPKENIPQQDEATLHVMEKDIKQTSEKLEAVKEEEHELEVEQEQKVSLYQRFMKLFQREQRMEEDIAELEMKTQPVANDPSVTEDFRTLAQIQMRWLGRMPTRMKDEFKESEDYQKYAEILQRRGVARKQ